MAIWLIRAIARPLNEAVGIARSVAHGDLTQRIEVHSTNETGQLLQALKDMNESLAGTVSSVRRGTETITVARSEEHTSELQSLMRISYAVFCLKHNHRQ